MNPFVSVVIPAYNEEKYINQSINSILQQTYTNWEIIIIDDASTDNTRKILSNYASSRIHILSCSSNKGAGSAQNKGFMRAKGDLIAILAGDDQAMPERLDKQVEYMTNNKDVAVLGTGYNVIDYDGRTIETRTPQMNALEAKWSLLFGNPLAAPTVMIRTKVLRECGYYNESIKFGEDMELWGRIAAKWNIGVIPTPLTKYRIHNSSLTRTTSFLNKIQFAGIVIQSNIKSLTNIQINRDVAEVLASWIHVPCPTNSDILNNAIDVILTCSEYYKHNYCERRDELKLINEHVLKKIIRMIRIYGFRGQWLKQIFNNKQAMVHTEKSINVLFLCLKAQVGYLRQRSVEYLDNLK